MDLKGDEILVNSAEGRVKQRNIARDPGVVISIVDSANPYTMVTVRGRVVRQGAEGAQRHIDLLAKKYLGLDKHQIAASGEKRILLRIKPANAFFQPPRQ